MNNRKLRRRGQRRPKIAHDDLCVVAGKWLRRNGVIDYSHELDNRRPMPLVTVKNHLSYNNEHPDVIGFSSDSRYTTVIEVKTSRSDFLKDSKKSHRVNIGMGDLRYYCCPEGLITPDELPWRWGLLYYDGKRIWVVSESLAFISVDRKSERYLLGYYLRYSNAFLANRINLRRKK